MHDGKLKDIVWKFNDGSEGSIDIVVKHLKTKKELKENYVLLHNFENGISEEDSKNMNEVVKNLIDRIKKEK